MSAWQPIETAPQGNGQLLGWFPMEDARGSVHVMHWDTDAYASRPKPHWSVYDWLWGKASMRRNQPTHWMPLPAPPETP